MKIALALLLVFSLAACRNEPQIYEIDSTLHCELANADGTITTREFRYMQSFTSYRRANIGWTYQGGAWVVTDLWFEGRIYKSVTPYFGESCAP